MRVETIANVMIFLTALFCIFERHKLSPGLAALSLTYALNIIGSVVAVVRMACNLENICVALERIFEYTNLPPEAEWKSDKGAFILLCQIISVECPTSFECMLVSCHLKLV